MWARMEMSGLSGFQVHGVVNIFGMNWAVNASLKIRKTNLGLRGSMDGCEDENEDGTKDRRHRYEWVWDRYANSSFSEILQLSGSEMNDTEFFYKTCLIYVCVLIF
ncbi:hypothetical protein EYC84_002427 [Monilinia fructicola]|uniref:Uncharacterized protein n=1 Tax=Monilinia fructicola TaxID=38448 RepID=A0A5M9JKT9_MONFR|nr:hypothetical protein EYC84_002427 [Monilinia fructicola]